MTKKVIIIGGGICGLTTAISLSRAGLEVVVFERSDTLREVGAGLTLWTNGIYALKKIGVDEPILASGQVVQNFEFFNSKGRNLGKVDIQATQEKMGVPHVSIHRMRLMNALENLIDVGEKVKFNHEFVSFTQDSASVHAHFANGHVETGDILLACDGFNSKARLAILHHDQKRYAGYTCWRGVTRIPSTYTTRGDIRHYVGPGSQVGIFDVGHETVCWYATANVPAGRKETTDERKQQVLEKFADWPEEVLQIFQSTESDDYLKNDIYDRDPVGKWINDRVMLMGDAAHPTTPNLGQGACQAIEDASVIAECLQKHSSHRHAFARFARLRKRRTAQIVLSSRRAGEIGQQDNPLIVPVRNFVLEALVKTGQMKEFEQTVCYKV
jgi:2-polyprenyl-6-methoxyphenol hydroxylase-like FAD-dependent oxidoreductase